MKDKEMRLVSTVAANFNPSGADIDQLRALFNELLTQAIQAIVDTHDTEAEFAEYSVMSRVSTGSVWDEHPDYPVADWQHEVRADDTRLGYWDWVESQKALSEHPVFLTNCCCERAHGDAALFKQLGLQWDESEGDFYPLVPTEAKFIGEDEVRVGRSDYYAFMGYSSLYRREKWLMPVIELSYQSEWFDEPSLPTRGEARHRTQTMLAQLTECVTAVGGHLFEGKGQDRFEIRICLPFSLAETKGDFEGWKAYLENELFADIEAA